MTKSERTEGMAAEQKQRREGEPGVPGVPVPAGTEPSGGPRSVGTEQSGGPRSVGTEPSGGPAPESGPDASAATALLGPADPTDVDGLDPAEAELRDLMHGLVGELKPAPQALDRLRVAVPLRRARRRQLQTGLVAACLVAAAAVPVALHVAGASRSAGPTPANVASTSNAHGGGAHHGSTGSPRAGWNGGASGGGASGGTRGAHGRTHGTGKGGAAAASAPACTAADLGTPTSSVSPLDATGHATGSFRVVNTSSAACSVGAASAGTLALSAQDGADPARFTLADHTVGDASGLGAVGGTVVVEPGHAYEVRFGFAPDGTGCPAGGSGGASPSPTPTGGADGSGDAGSTGASGSAGGSTGGTGTDQGSGPGSGSGSGSSSSSSSSSDGGAGVASGSDVSLNTGSGTLVVTYTPPGGGTVASAFVRGVCGGTVFRNAPLAASAS